ncbi:MAG: hypothetical protein KY476_23655, partial [Planctomycetes bacterium]|nr:hypothetical protein [Planctomycetota bacterium]
MMHRRMFSAALVALVLAVQCALLSAATLRESPLVRAIRKAQTAVVSIHSEKTAVGGDSLCATGTGR